MRNGSGPASGTVLIELGTDRGEPDSYTTPGHGTLPGWLPLALVVLLVMISSVASAAPPAPPLSVLLSVPVRPADPYVLTDDGTLLVHAPLAGTMTGVDLATGRTRWETPAAVPAYRVRSGAGLILLRTRYATRPDVGTVAVSAETGRVRWRVGGTVLTVPGAPTVIGVSEVRSIAGDGRRIEGPVTGLDPYTGKARWTLPVPSTAVLLGVPPAGLPAASGSLASGPLTGGSLTEGSLTAGAGASAAVPRLLLVHDSGLAELHDTGTGRRLASVHLPPADYAPGDPGVIGGMLLLRHPNGVGSQVSAYDLTTLQRRWSRSAEAAYDITACGPLACLVGPSGVRALDPADGAQRWHRPGWRSVEQRGGVTLAYGSLSGSSDLVGVVHPDSGQVAMTLDRWRPVAGQGGGDHLLVTRADAPDGRTMVAVAHPGAARPRPLGELPPGTGDCRTVPDRLVCRSSDGTLVVWSYAWR